MRRGGRARGGEDKYAERFVFFFFRGGWRDARQDGVGLCLGLRLNGPGRSVTDGPSQHTQRTRTPGTEVAGTEVARVGAGSARNDSAT